jgi:arginine decarboxylase
VAKSHWIEDFGRFYGMRLFLAETSATTGGLDSLLQPTGSLKLAQQRAARAFGADRTFFVTNGTSTANKIVTQALCRPGDIVLLSHDCHKSHPYAAILGGTSPVYLDAYPLTDYSMYGGVTLREIKRQLFLLQCAGKLDRVRLLLLTNITFDGITYDPYRVMKEVLAIKPDILFLWDEAWFAYGRFSPILRRRTAMDAAAQLDQELHSKQYRAEYDRWRSARKHLPTDRESTFVDHALMPDPDRVRLRVYATQSTHKTLTALRQGSMIHIRDVDFEREASEAFHEAYMTHTSTSANYQILASLDAGRRQV